MGVGGVERKVRGGGGGGVEVERDRERELSETATS